MSIAAQTASALARAVFISGAAVALSGWLARSLAGMRGRTHTIAWALLLAPFLTPSVLISYAFSRFALALIVWPWSHQALYIAVLLLKLVPVATLIRWLMPPPLSAEARHCHRTLAAPSLFEIALFRFRGVGPGPWFAGGIVFLLAFADFELASLWSVKTWTVGIFDAQTGGLNLFESLRLTAFPLGIQLAVLTLLTLRGGRTSCPAKADRTKLHPFIFVYLGAVAVIVCALPLLIVTVQAAAGFRAVMENFVLGNEIAASVLFAFCAAVLANVRFLGARVIPGIPGLLGSLMVALLVLALFQTPLLHPAYDTPLPLLLALTIFLLPLALLQRALLEMRSTSPMRHIARQIGSRRLAWDLERQPRLAAFGLLFCWAYFDFTASSILAPVGMTPVFVRLHNLAHYGQTAVLSAMMLAAFATPVALLLLTIAAGKIYSRRDAR